MDLGKWVGWAAYVTVLSSASKSNEQEETTAKLKSEIKALRLEIKELKGEPIEDCNDEEICNEVDDDGSTTDAVEGEYAPLIAPGFAKRTCFTFWVAAITSTVFRYVGEWIYDLFSLPASDPRTATLHRLFSEITGMFEAIFWPLAWAFLLFLVIKWGVQKFISKETT